MIKKGCIILITLLNTLGLSAQSTKVYTPIPPYQVHATASSEITKAAEAVNGEGMEGDMHIAQNLGHKMWTSKASTGKIRANEFTKEGVVWFMCEIGKTSAPMQVDLIKIWNQNQSQHTRRGLKKVYIEYSADGKTWKLLKNKELDYHIIRESKGQNPEPASFIFETSGIKAKYICITADANGEGNYYDPKDKYILREAADMQQNVNYYGLSEIRFYQMENKPVAKLSPLTGLSFVASQGYLKTGDGPTREYTIQLNAPLFCGGELDFDINGRKWKETIKPSASGTTIIEGVFPAGYMEESAKVSIKLRSKQGDLAQDYTIPGARRWKLYFLPHSHQDIGYTHAQDDVMKLQWRNFERALDLAERTANNPEGSRFKWNSEATWALMGYLDNYKGTEKGDKMIKAIKDGTLGVDASLGSILTGISKQEELMHMFDDAHRISEITGVEFNTAMMSDVPGQSWGMVTAMAQNGVKYYSSGPNYVPFYGKVGNDRAAHLHVKWGDKPFYWQAQSGKDKVLFWQTGRGYSWFHGWLINRLSACGVTPVWEYLADLESKEYPYATTYLRYTVNGDNGPPDELMPDVIKAWNEKYESPKFYIGTTKELFTEFEKQYGDNIPVYGGDITPTWEDGAASTARELAMNRESSERLNQTEILWSMLNPAQFPAKDFLEAWKNVVLFSEHTWGASASGPEPESEFTKKLWAGKKLYADNADEQSKKLYAEAFSTIRFDKGNYIHVFNTNLWNRTDVVTVDKNVNLEGKILESPSGEIVPVQKIHDGSWIFIAKDIPALSSAVYKITGDKRGIISRNSLIHDNILDNGIVRVELDKVKGTISSFSKVGEDYNYASERGLNDYIYTGRFAADPEWVDNIKGITILNDGEVAATLRVESDAPGCRSLLRDITVYKGIGRVDILNTIDKENIYQNEHVRFIFPFNIDHGEITMDLAMGEMHPERDQLAGVNKNYYSIQNGLSAGNLSHGIYLTTIDAPFVELGEMTCDVWRQEQNGLGWRSSALISPKIYSWVMNNSWRTNYKASQDGIATFRYSLELFDPFDRQLKKQGSEQAQKMIAVVSENPAGVDNLFRLKGKNQISISTIKPSDDGNGYIVRLLNLNDRSVHSSFVWGSLQAEKVYLCDHKQQQTGHFDDSSFRLKPYECITLKIIVKKKPSLSDYVNPGIGTAHSRWFFYTPAAVPFGMAKLAPSTDAHLGNPGGWQAVGYDARHTSIEGFANFHEFQIGGVVIAPTVGKLQTVPGALDNIQGGYRSSFDKKDEYACPGYYSVLLKDYAVKAELTATQRVGFHRYTFPASKQANLIFDIGNRQGESGYVKDASVTYTEDGRIEGWVTTAPVYVNIYQKGATVSMYFSAVLDKNPVAFGSFVKDTVYPALRSQTGVGAGLYFQFNTTEKETVTVKIGLSYTSIENARLNMKTEAENMNFDKAHKKAVDTWNDYLGRIKAEGGEYNDRVKFYTGLYHALLGRGLASDVNGAYPKNDGGVGQIALDAKGKPIHNHYNTDAIWGAFWNLTQLWSIAYPEYYSDWIQSQLLVYKDAGWLGDGIAGSKYVSGVGTNFTGLAIAAAYNCGIRDFDVKTGYEAALKNEIDGKDRLAGAGKLDVEQFVNRGYSPYATNMSMRTTTEGSGFGASHTMEYSFSSYAVAQMAKQLGKKDDYRLLTKLSNGWKLLFDADTKLIRPRDVNGDFIKDFDPFAPWIGFQEGNAIQYTYYVPHQIDELINLIGADDFNTRLDSTFQISRKNIFGGGEMIDAFSGLHTYYNHGNQPNLHISWLFNFSGKPYLSQKWVRAICNEFYGVEGIHGYGYGQDEDQGQLGAWYVMAAIGLFDVKGLTGANPTFQIGSPLFDKITIKLNKDYYPGKEFIIETQNNAKNNIYIQSIDVNGKPHNTVQLPFPDVVKGGRMLIKLSDTPDKRKESFADT